jgi:hypothetical protein
MKPKLQKETVDPSRIAWGLNTSKRLADAMLYRSMAFDLMRQYRRMKKRLRILSFPAQTWVWEQALASDFPDVKMEFLGLERDPRIHKKTAKFGEALPQHFKMTAGPVDFRSFADLTTRRRPYDVIYLDWMGTWSKEKKEDIAAMFRNELLAVGGMLLLTVSLRRGRPETMDELTDLSYDLPLAFYDARGEDKYTSNLKVRGIPHWVQNYAKEYFDIDMRPLMASVYYSSTGLSHQVQPQLQIVLLRET